MSMNAPSRYGIVFAVLAAMFLCTVVPAYADQNSKPVVGIHLVHQQVASGAGQRETAPEGYRFLPAAIEGDGDYLVESEPLLTDKNFAEVTAGFDQHTGQPVVNFRLTDEATSRFAEITRDNIGRAMAIVVDGKVVTAPVIQTEISGGAGVITGNFTVQEVADLVARITGKTAE